LSERVEDELDEMVSTEAAITGKGAKQRRLHLNTARAVVAAAFENEDGVGHGTVSGLRGSLLII
jgi:hypothetical protein